MPLRSSAFQQVSSSSLARKEEDLARGEELPYMYGGLNAVHVGHDDVTDYEVGLDGTGPLDGTCARIHRRGIKAVLIQNDCERVGNNPLIVNN